ncbi:MAG: beta-agarase [Coraliomargaritaceae bacterium]
MIPKFSPPALVAFAALFLASVTNAETKSSVQLNVEHRVGGLSQFDRQKYITVHSSLTESDWEGEEEKLDYLINDLDVHFGRDNGIMILYAEKAGEDPARSGYADPVHMQSLGQYYRETFYGQEYAYRHGMDTKNDVMIGGQVRTFWPAEANPKGTGKLGWPLDGVDAAGEFMGHFLNEFYRDAGEPSAKGPSRPKYLEILNEPLYELIDGNRGSIFTPKDIFQFHNEAAKAIRRINQTTLLGGYTMAFPIFEERDFARWDERMKLFIDMSGDYMDFLSIHFYDFNNRGSYGKDYYKGGRVEATLDLIEQYCQLRLGEVMPFVISEYGGRDHGLERGPWSPLRDWQFMKAFSPLMLSFMDRPDRIMKSIPFIVGKAEWGTKDGIPYSWRLLRQANEVPGQTSEDWVFTEQIKFYELWSDVNGSRVWTESSNPDVMMDCYVDGNQAYLILSNLSTVSETVELEVLNTQQNEVEAVKVKHLYLQDDTPVLAEEEQSDAPRHFTLGAEATAILAYRFADPILVNQRYEETKYYASDYNQAIHSGEAISFSINEIKECTEAKAVLRIGFGREQELSRKPVVRFNGELLEVPQNLRGSEQARRPAFFGLLEIPVPEALIQLNNTISIEFPDSGGRVSSVTMRYFVQQ